MKILIGAVVGALVGLGLNHLCKLTGGSCPLMGNIITSVIIWSVIGAIAGAGLMIK